MQNENLILVTVKTQPQRVFQYNSIDDLENLSNLTNQKPSIDFENGKLIPKFKKTQIPENSAIFLNGDNTINRVIPFEDLEKNFDILPNKTK